MSPPPKTPSAARAVLFARYPTPGAAKTRLIPALGAAGAAALHRRLAERTLGTLRMSGLEVEVRTTGAAASEFEAWLGPGPAYVDQGPGDLGARLARAASRTPVIIVGADAPGLTPSHLEAAREALGRAPVVLGPAEDGGYYLVGLATPEERLFRDIPWGGPRVLGTTLERAKASGLEVALLQPLADLDRPEDLGRWPDLLA